MYKDIVNLIKVSCPSDMDSSLPFVITTDNGEKRIVWFNFTGDYNKDNKFDICIQKIFVMSSMQHIEVTLPDLHVVIDFDDYEFTKEQYAEYIEAFQNQFRDNVFVDKMELLASTENKNMMDVYEAVIKYITTSRKIVCKHCGSDAGFYTKLSGVQYYTNTGEDDGYEVDVEGASVYCRTCKKRVCSVEQFRRGTI